jgi:hypothetical protein
MDQGGGIPPLEGGDLVARLEELESRLLEQEQRQPPPGLTEPDPDTDERWEAAQVWAHMAEFVGYWRQEAESVIAAFHGEPVPFGRVKSDPGRIAAIETGRREPIGTLAQQARGALAELKSFLSGLGTAELNAMGCHQTAGDLDVAAIIERFVLDHLDEHLAQLDALDDGAE